MITMTTNVWLLLVVIASSRIVVNTSQSSSSNRTCRDGGLLGRLEGTAKQLVNNQQELLEYHQTILDHLESGDTGSSSCSGDLLNEIKRDLKTLLSRSNNGGISVSMQMKLRDCSEIYALGERSDGVYLIFVGKQQYPIEVYCDMTNDGGGWTVFQLRKDGSEDFYRDWNEYMSGFGNLTGEFWLGNEKIHLLTSADTRYRMRVDMADWEGNTTYADYDNFKVGNRAELYKLMSLGRYAGTAGDSLRIHERSYFSTKDKDNDKWEQSCARDRIGAWWYNNCDESGLNGLYQRAETAYHNAVHWDGFRGETYSLMTTSMKIRPIYF